MGLSNVKWHEHVFPPDFDVGDDEADDVTGRFDAIEFENGEFAVYSAETKGLIARDLESREEALRVAHNCSVKRMEKLLDFGFDD